MNEIITLMFKFYTIVKGREVTKKPVPVETRIIPTKYKKDFYTVHNFFIYQSGINVLIKPYEP